MSPLTRCLWFSATVWHGLWPEENHNAGFSGPWPGNPTHLQFLNVNTSQQCQVQPAKGLVKRSTMRSINPFIHHLTTFWCASRGCAEHLASSSSLLQQAEGLTPSQARASPPDSAAAAPTVNPTGTVIMISWSNTHHKPLAGLKEESVTALMDQQFAVDTLVAVPAQPPYPFTTVATEGFL